MKMIFCVVLIIAAVCIAALVCYGVSWKMLQEKIKERDTKKAVLAKKSKRWHEKALTPPTIEIVGFPGGGGKAYHHAAYKAASYAVSHHPLRV